MSGENDVNEVGVATETGFEILPDVDVDDNDGAELEDAFSDESLVHGDEREDTRGYHCDEHKIAQLPNIPQFKLVWKMKKIGLGIKTLMPCVRRRLKKTVVFAKVCYPTDVGKGIIGKCVGIGLSAAGLAILSGLGAPLAADAFLKAFEACAGNEVAKKLKVHIHTKVEYTPYK